MRLSKQFVKSLEELAANEGLSPNERLEAAGLLVRLYTASPQAATTKADSGKSKAESASLAKLAGSL